MGKIRYLLQSFFPEALCLPQRAQCVHTSIHTHTHTYMCILSLTYTQTHPACFAHTCIHIHTLTLKHTDSSHGAQDTRTRADTLAHIHMLSGYTSSHSHIHSHSDTNPHAHTHMSSHTHSHVLTRTGVFPTQPSPTPRWWVCSQAADSASVRG